MQYFSTARTRLASSLQEPLLLLLLFLIAWPLFPRTIQVGDSVELVANARDLIVSHPPGFPLYHWLFHLLLKPVSLPNQYFAASIFCFLLLSIGVILLTRSLPFLGRLAFVLTAFASQTILRQSLIPDVFALHNCLLCLLLLAVFNSVSIGKGHWNVVVLFSLGLANHPTFLLLAPFLFLTFYGRGVRFAILALALMSPVVLLFYSSLLFLETEHPASWPMARSFVGVLRHGLRVDYGVFQLSAHPIPVDLWGHLTHFWIHGWPILLSGSLVLVLASAHAIKKKRKMNGFYTAAAGALALYLLIFYARANMSHDGFAGFTLERFHAHPLLILLGTAIFASRNIRGPWSLGTIGFIPLAFVGLSNSVANNQWGRNTVLEDLILNFRESAKSSKADCRIFLADSDSLFFGLNYFRNLPVDSGSAPFIVTNAKLGLRGYQEKLKKLGLRLDGDWTEGRTIDALSQFIIPNLDRCDFFTLHSYQGSSSVKVVYLPIGRRITKGQGEEISPAHVQALNLRMIPSRKGVDILTANLFAYYSHYLLRIGVEERRQGRWKRATDAFESALKFSPGDKTIKRNICLTRKLSGEQNIECSE